MKINRYWVKPKRHDKTYRRSLTKYQRKQNLKIVIAIFASITLGILIELANTTNSLEINGGAVKVSTPRTSLFVEQSSEAVRPKTTASLPVMEVSAKEVKQEIIKQSKMFGVNTEDALRIGWCESMYVYNIDNWEGSGAKGVFQFKDKTWKWIKAEGHQYDYKENIKQFMIWYKIYPSWWACS